MAQYKVPQDVEADDKLIGPFSFRQFVYLLIVAGLIALAIGLFQIFPVLVLIPLPLILLFGALALPLKKDQPMETYLAAIVSYYLKPRKRFWLPGQRESTINIIAPKIVEENRTRNITGEEATHRLSFLADIVDTEGQAIKGMAASSMRDDLVAEANATSDMFEADHFNRLEDTIEKDENARYQEVVREMREAIEKNENLNGKATIQKNFATENTGGFEPGKVITDSPVVVQPEPAVVEKAAEKVDKVEPVMAKPSIIELANNPVYSVETIAKEANRIKERDDGEVFISLH
ncbi:PrgI family protein [Candidatus Saccharibacteria bacterium]|nr:PrgI family protein [Candidatus Saccharibacteria bacterium]